MAQFINKNGDKYNVPDPERICSDCDKVFQSNYGKTVRCPSCRINRKKELELIIRTKKNEIAKKIQKHVGRALKKLSER